MIPDHDLREIVNVIDRGDANQRNLDLLTYFESLQADLVRHLDDFRAPNDTMTELARLSKLAATWQEAGRP